MTCLRENVLHKLVHDSIDMFLTCLTTMEMQLNMKVEKRKGRGKE